jgi:hypothetical protein
VSDQYGNKVDGEIWIDQVVQYYGAKDGSQKPPMPASLDSWTEFAIAFADGKIDEERFSDEGLARQQLKRIRSLLEEYGVPEEGWPVLMEREVEIIATSWKILNV